MPATFKRDELEAIKGRALAQLHRHGATYGPFLRVVVDATPREWNVALGELVADGQVTSDSSGTVRLA